MKYYLPEDIEAIVNYACGWTLGNFQKNRVGPTYEERQAIARMFKPRDIRDLIEYPLKKEKI